MLGTRSALVGPGAFTGCTRLDHSIGVPDWISRGQSENRMPTMTREGWCVVPLGRGPRGGFGGSLLRGRHGITQRDISPLDDRFGWYNRSDYLLVLTWPQRCPLRGYASLARYVWNEGAVGTYAV